MNYAIPTDRVFATSGVIKTKTIMSETSRSIRKFCATHTVKVYDNPQTGEIVVKVAEVEADNDTDQRNE